MIAGTGLQDAAHPALSRNRNFALLWFGETVSLLGTATTSVLLPLLAIRAFDAGPGWMGVLTAATWLPWLVIGLPAGAWIDQLPPRTVMIAADLAGAGALASVPIAQIVGILTLGHLLAAALLVGTATVFFRTAYAGLVPSIVGADDLEKANSRLFGTESGMQVAGPGLAGVLAQWFSVAVGLLLDAGSFLVSAVCLWRIRGAGRALSPAPSPESLRTRIAAGVSWLRHDPYYRPLVIIGSVSNFGLTGINTLMVIFLVREVGLNPAGVGLVLMAGSVGGFAGAVVAPRISAWLGSGRASTWLLVLSGPPAFLSTFAAPGWRTGWAVCGLAGVGAFVVAGNVIRGAWRQQYIPTALLGRVITAGSVINYGLMPLGALAAGAIASALGIREALIAMAAVHAAAGLSILVSRVAGLRILPTVPAPSAPAPDASSPGDAAGR